MHVQYQNVFNNLLQRTSEYYSGLQSDGITGAPSISSILDETSALIGSTEVNKRQYFCFGCFCYVSGKNLFPTESFCHPSNSKKETM
jgi:hypothetical protein